MHKQGFRPCTGLDQKKRQPYRRWPSPQALLSNSRFLLQGQTHRLQIEKSHQPKKVLQFVHRALEQKHVIYNYRGMTLLFSNRTFFSILIIKCSL